MTLKIDKFSKELGNFVKLLYDGCNHFLFIIENDKFIKDFSCNLLINTQIYNTKVLFLINDYLANKIINSTEQTLFINELLLSEKLEFVTVKEKFTDNKKIEINKIISFLQEKQIQALENKILGIWIVIDMAWFAEGTSNISKVKELEWKLQDFPCYPNTKLFCFYDLTQFTIEIINWALEMHESVIINGKICCLNPYFTYFNDKVSKSRYYKIYEHRKSFLLKNSIDLFSSNKENQTSANFDNQVEKHDEKYIKRYDLLKIHEIGMIDELWRSIYKVLFGSEKFNDLVAELVNIIKKIVEAEYCIVILKEAYNNIFYVIYTDYDNPYEIIEQKENNETIKLLNPNSVIQMLVENVIKTQKSFCTNDFLEHPLLKIHPHPQILFSRVMAVPFYSDIEPAGCIFFASRSNDFNSSKLIKVQEFSQFLGFAIFKRQIQQQLELLCKVLNYLKVGIAITNLDCKLISYNNNFGKFMVEKGYNNLDGIDLVECVFDLETNIKQIINVNLLKNKSFSISSPKLGMNVYIECLNAFAFQKPILLWVLKMKDDITSELETVTIDSDFKYKNKSKDKDIEKLFEDMREIIISVISNLENINLNFDKYIIWANIANEVKGGVDRIWLLLSKLKSIINEIDKRE